MKNMHLHIPDYMWKTINEMELPGNTVTSKLLILLEKGINYYAKANKKTAKRANQGSQIQEHDTPNPQNQKLYEINEQYNEDIQHTLEIAQTRWANEEENNKPEPPKRENFKTHAEYMEAYAKWYDETK